MRKRIALITVALLACLMWNNAADAEENGLGGVADESPIRIDEADERGEWYEFDSGIFYFYELAQPLG